MTTAVKTKLDYALEYARQGFPVFPVGANKHPLLSENEGYHGYLDATTDEALIKQWWTRFPDANIAWWTKGYIVIDEDNKNGQPGKESLAKFKKEHPFLPRTRVHKTGSQLGHHYIYKKTGSSIIGSHTIAPGLEIRADKGCILMPGSILANGGEYTVLIDEPIADAPEWLEKYLAEFKGSGFTDVGQDGEPIPPGNQDNWLYSRACGYRAKGDSYEAILEKVKLDIQRCPQQPGKKPYTDKDAERIAKSASQHAPNTTPAATENSQPVIKLVSLDEILPEKVTWLWHPYIPIRKLTLIEGDPGCGKSWVSLAIATAVSRGAGLPNAETTEPRITIIASAEDGMADTIVPRLINLEADRRLIKVVDGLFTLDDNGCQLVENYISEYKPLLVVIDPLQAYLSANVDIAKSNQVRQITARLASIANDYNCAIVCIRHLTKGGSAKPIYRGLGSIDFTASARSVLLAGEDPETGARGLVHIKSNLAPKGEAIGYTLEADRFYWTGASDLTASRILSIDNGGTSLSNATAFLEELLITNGDMTEADIKEQAKLADIAERTLFRAKKDLGVISKRKGTPGKRGGGTWFWGMPNQGENND